MWANDDGSKREPHRNRTCNLLIKSLDALPSAAPAGGGAVALCAIVRSSLRFPLPALT